MADNDGFDAPTELIRAGASWLTVCGAAAEKAKGYVEQNTEIEQGGALLTEIRSAHDLLVAQVQSGLGKLAQICDGSGTELTKTADSYENTDQASAQKVDGAYKDPYANQVDVGGPTK